MADMLKKRGLDNLVKVSSSATSREEEGNPIYPPAERKLRQMGVCALYHRARQLKKEDIDKYDYIIAMEERNVQAIKRIAPDAKNVHRLLDFSQNPRDIADPWWTGNFDVTYDDIVEGCECFLDYLLKNDIKH